MEMQGMEGIVECMAKWMSRRYFAKVPKDQFEFNSSSQESLNGTEATKIVMIESPPKSPDEPDNENLVEENNNQVHWCFSSFPYPYYSLPSPKSPTSSWGSFDALSGPPSPTPPPTPSFESESEFVPDYAPSTPPHVKSPDESLSEDKSLQVKTTSEAKLKIRSDLFSAAYSKWDVNEDDFNDYVAVSAPPIITLPKPVPTAAANITTVTLDEDGNSPEIINLSDDDDDDIREIFDERNIFTQFRPTNNPELDATNPEELNELQDLNDPGWETVRNLKDDHERRQFAIASFGNIEPADPTKNMSYHGFLRQQLKLKEGLIDEDNPKPEEYIGEGLKIRDGIVDQVEKYHDDSFVDELEETKIQIDEASRKRKAVDEHEEAPQAKRQMIEVGVYRRKLEHLAVRYKKRNVRLYDMRFYMRHWRMGANETMEFLHYYREDTNNNLVSIEELHKTECIEMIMNQFVNFYGVRERELCKECTYQEGCEIFHSM